MKRKILSGLVGVAMLGAAASANAFLFSSTSDLNGTVMSVSSLNSGAAGFSIAMQLVAGDNIDVAFTGAAHDLYATGAMGMDYKGAGMSPVPDGVLDFTRIYSNLNVFSGDIVAAYTGSAPDMISFGGASSLGGTVITDYDGVFHNFPLLGISGSAAGQLIMNWTYTTGSNVLLMNFTENSLSGWTGFEQALYAFGNSLTGLNLNSYGGKLYSGSAVSTQPAGSTGNYTLTAVPEPASLALLGIGIAGLGFMRRRKA